MKERVIKHALICFGIMLLLTIVALFSRTTHIGFFGYVIMLIAGTLFTTIGVGIAEAFRRFVIPDMLLASGAYDMLLKKVFWLIGPQAIGWFIGTVATQGQLRNLGF
jgi:hypothetical protein